MVDYGIIYTQPIIHQAGRCDFLITPEPMQKPSTKRISTNPAEYAFGILH